jgi:hypothetical protein
MSYAAVEPPQVVLQNWTNGASAININSTSAKVNIIIEKKGR